MQSLIEVLPYLADYHPSFAALAILCFAVIFQGFLTAPLAFASGREEPGSPLKGTHADLSFRAVRTYANSVENLPVFAATLFLAVIAGVDATWVNWLVGIHLISRLLFWAVYYAGVGKIAGGPRTLAYVGGLLSNAILAGMTVYALVF